MKAALPLEPDPTSLTAPPGFPELKPQFDQVHGIITNVATSIDAGIIVITNMKEEGLFESIIFYTLDGISHCHTQEEFQIGTEV